MAGDRVFWLRLLAGLGLVLAVAGCNTVQGIGKDIQKGGQSLEKAAK